MATATEKKQLSEMVICEPGNTRTITYNGVPEERAEVKALFESLVGSGAFFAYSVDKKDPTKAEVVKDFPEEAERIVISPRLVGGCA